MSDLVRFTVLSAVAVLHCSVRGWTLRDVPADQARVNLCEAVPVRA
jgi:hypothetical protein